MRLKIICCVLLAIGEIFPVLGVTLFIQRALNQSVQKNDLQQLFFDGLGVIFCTLLITLLALANTRIALRVSRTVSSDLYSRIVDKCLRLNPTFFYQNNAASFNHSIIHDTDKLYSMGNVFLVKFIPALIVSVAILFFLFFINPWLTLILVGGMPAFFFCSHKIERKLKTHGVAMRQSLQNFNQGIRFLFDMMDLIQTHSTQELERQEQGKKIAELGERMHTYFWFASLYNLCQNFIVAIASIAILIVGGSMVIQGKMYWGHLISFYIAVGMLKRYAQTLISSIPPLIEGRAAFAKISTFLEEDEKSPYQGIKQIPFKGHLRFENVAFSFSEKPLFQNVNLSLQAGEIAALLGANGAGKSTIANLILGFYRPERGTIYFDGEPLEKLDIKQLRSSIAIVRQSHLIFPGTIRENLFYGAKPGACLEEAIFRVGLTQFIDELPLKLDTPTGMSGLYLSGGQKQKIALARALLRQPKLLILDEPTNHLDAASVESIFQSLKEWKKERSILIISHHKDLSSLADKTYRFSEGTVQDFHGKSGVFETCGL